MKEMSELSASGTIALPRPPFNNPAADTIIQSSDGVNFRVRSGIVAEASPIFCDMFSIPLPDASSIPDSPDFIDGKPVVAVQENSVTLDRLLRLCYPTADPPLPKLKDVRPVLAAAIKYEMEEAVALMKLALLGFVDRQPLAVWATACELRLEDEAKAAAKALVGTDIPADAPPELENVTAGAYYRLLKFHRAGGAVSESFKFSEPDPEDIPKSKPSRARPVTSLVYQPRPFADIICRSSDGTEYLTHKIILSTASPLLHDRIDALPPNPPSTLPVLELDVHGAPLGPLLELCYPVKRDSMELRDLPIRDVLAMLFNARRLEMESPFHLLRYGAVGWLKVSHSFAIYLLASNLGLSEIAEDALQFLHADPFTYGYIPEMETVPALAYHQLFVNRRASLAVASTLTNKFGVSPNGGRRTSPPGESKADGTSAGSPGEESSGTDTPTASGDPWLRGILERTAEELRSPNQDERWFSKPDTSETLEESLKRKLWCGTCEENLRLVLQIEKLYTEVRQAMEANNGKLKAV
ncbi:hypothetical protein L226DRAFT_506146 [Lentinus tigrinus ALCF2SS1-7]|uniref:BTB domain-containing protein n=1 Tax=Lentinus tigrinus ALCF2SS1-6 TaxID=1328759 RepID=A0A5C2SSW6_9APHY|nr:hypothetical protein L227DRAFT_542360 [Lentinus tigrinus ALCF2SS1-6]RPD76647.1 hypothetical protein L226DRAFT_506146 [Lentinus tigrinus ALCF2SS1-7]